MCGVSQEEFDGKEFPYDKQVSLRAWLDGVFQRTVLGLLSYLGCEALTIQLASATYMDDAVQLVPCKDYSFTDAGPAQFAKSDWTYLWNDLTSFVEISGPLRKSRAQFVVHIVRDASPFLSGTIFPEIMIVVLGYTVPLLAMVFSYSLLLRFRTLCVALQFSFCTCTLQSGLPFPCQSWLCHAACLIRGAASKWASMHDPGLEAR